MAIGFDRLRQNYFDVIFVGKFMKKLLVIGILVCSTFMTFPVYPQTNWVGFSGGINMVSMSEDPKEEPHTLGARKAFLVSGVASFGLSGQVALLFRPAFVQKGTSLTSIFRDPPVGIIMSKESWKLYYFNLPVLMKMAFNNKTRAKPYGLAGLNTGFLLAATSNFENKSIDGEPQTIQSDDINVRNNFKNFDWGLIIGSGVDIPLGENGGRIVFIEATYGLGIADISEVTGSDVSYKNREFQIIFGVLFRLGGQ